MARTLIIAEAGVNHCGDINRALDMVRVAHACGADAVKFQTFCAASLATSSAPMAEYQARNIGKRTSQADMLRSLELSLDDHVKLKAACDWIGIEFLSTPFDVESARLLNGFVKRWKVASGEITNAPLLMAMKNMPKPVILSTGMSTLGDVEFATSIIGGDNVTLLHCTSEYPCPDDSVNLLAMDTLRDRFGMPVGYSDHTTGIHVPVAAVARGAIVIEKHFTLDRALPGPDHVASLIPWELKDMCEAIRRVKRALGDGVKQPTEVEKETAKIPRKSLVALTHIKKGDLFTEYNLGTKRPGTGVSAKYFYDYIGVVADRDYGPDDMVREVRAAEASRP